MTKEQKMLLKALQDNRRFAADIEVRSAVCLVLAMQLAYRHPLISDWLKDEITQLALPFQAGVEFHVSGMWELLEKGWDETLDVEQETDDND